MLRIEIEREEDGRWIREVDDIIVETSGLIAEHGLDLDTVRDALFAEFGGGPVPPPPVGTTGALRR
jgi:hypothetical protein